MQRFDGRLFHGPFSKLLTVLNGIGWRVGTPPIIVDEEDLAHDLLSVPLPALRSMAERAWLRYVAHEHQHRGSMAGLDGIDVALARLDGGQQHRPPESQPCKVGPSCLGRLSLGST